MIQTETVTINGKEYKHTFSDQGFYIEREGEQYADAIDPIEAEREYTETTVKVENKERIDEE